jgi:hypothetical protein
MDAEGNFEVEVGFEDQFREAMARAIEPGGVRDRNLVAAAIPWPLVSRPVQRSPRTLEMEAAAMNDYSGAPPRRTLHLTEWQRKVVGKAFARIRRQMGRFNGRRRPRSVCLDMASIYFLNLPPRSVSGHHRGPDSDTARRPYWYRPHPGQTEMIDLAISHAKEMIGCETDEEAVTFICAEFLRWDRAGSLGVGTDSESSKSAVLGGAAGEGAANG